MPRTPMPAPDVTNDPHCNSWVPTANHGGVDFPIQNLPIAEFRRRDSAEAYRGGIAIGDQILDLAALAAAGAFGGDAALALRAAARSTLNDLMQLGPAQLERPAPRAVRGACSKARLCSRCSSRVSCRKRRRSIRCRRRSAISRISIPRCITRPRSGACFAPTIP